MISLQSSLGIQFGKNYLHLVYLKKSLKEVALDAHEFIPFPSDLLSGDLDKYLSQEISGFLNEKKIGKENVWVALPRDEFVLRFLTLPLSVEENLRDVIRYEMGKYLPFSEEDIYFDFLSLGREVETKKLKVLLLAIKKPVLERYLSILQNADIAPFGIEVSATALSNFFLLGQTGSYEKPVAVVNMERDGFEVHYIFHGMLHYSRAIDFDAEEEHHQIAQIIHELRNGFRIGFPLQVFNNGEDVLAVYLSGDGTKDDFIARFASTREIPFETFPGDTISSRLKFSDLIPLRLSAGIGLALKGIHKVPLDVNLLPPVLQKKIKKTGLTLSFSLIITLLLLMFCLGISSIVKERLQLRKVEKEIEALKPDVLAVQKIQKEAQDIAHRIETLAGIQQSQSSTLEIMKELSSILPPSVWITEFRDNKNEVDLAGFAASASGLIEILGGSPYFHASEFTAPITKDMEGKESFRIKTTIKEK